MISKKSDERARIDYRQFNKSFEIGSRRRKAHGSRRLSAINQRAKKETKPKLEHVVLGDPSADDRLSSLPIFHDYVTLAGVQRGEVCWRGKGSENRAAGRDLTSYFLNFWL